MGGFARPVLSTTCMLFLVAAEIHYYADRRRHLNETSVENRASDSVSGKRCHRESVREPERVMGASTYYRQWKAEMAKYASH